MTLAIVIAGLLVMTLIGFVARRRPAPNLSEWTVAGRHFGSVTLWFLQAGEIFTTFTFLGIAGLTVVGGVAALYAVLFEGLGFLGLFFLAPRLWAYARDRGLLTQADFLESIYHNRLLGTVSALVTVLFTLPYLQIQLVGLGSIVQLVTGIPASRTVSIVVGGVLIVAFMLWSGIRGIAYQAYFKDVLLILVMLILAAAIPIGLGGGIGNVFSQVQQVKPQTLYIHGGPFDHVWFLTSLGVSAITVFFLAQAGTYPVIYSARSAQAARRNYIFLPLYFLILVVPMTIGFTALIVLQQPVAPDTTVLVLAARSLPEWLLGVVGVAGCAAALVPSAHLLLTISTAVARNVARVQPGRSQFLINHITVIAATAAAVVISVIRPDLIALLALLSYAGGVQLVPASAAALIPRTVWLRAESLTGGLIVGVGVVIGLTAENVNILNINSGVIGLACNLVVVGLAEVVLRTLRPTPDKTRLVVASSSRT
ncbi:MAG: sodium:solute symporter family protein [Chloroflexi bacterium]|nr:sodium:solute symporter family protein [Chloroflexota bacterium]